MKKEPELPLNLLELKPIRNVGSEVTAEGLVVLIVPKFKSDFLNRWVMPHLSHPNFRVKLDAHGSFIWNACDGRTSVAEIAAKMNEQFTEEHDALVDRIGKFVRKLDESKFVLFDTK